MKTTAIAGLIVAAGMAGCINVPPEQIMAAGKHKTFTLPRTPEEAFKRVVLGTEGCWSWVDVRSSFNTDARTGRVIASVTLGAATSTAYVADIAAATDGATVSLYTHKSFSEADRLMAAWSAGNFSSCTLR